MEDPASSRVWAGDPGTNARSAQISVSYKLSLVYLEVLWTWIKIKISSLNDGSRASVKIAGLAGLVERVVWAWITYGQEKVKDTFCFVFRHFLDCEDPCSQSPPTLNF